MRRFTSNISPQFVNNVNPCDNTLFGFGTHKVDKGMKGMTIPALQELLGHKKMETTYKYVHLAKTTLRQQQEATAL